MVQPWTWPGSLWPTFQHLKQVQYSEEILLEYCINNFIFDYYYDHNNQADVRCYHLYQPCHHINDEIVSSLPPEIVLVSSVDLKHLRIPTKTGMDARAKGGEDRQKISHTLSNLFKLLCIKLCVTNSTFRYSKCRHKYFYFMYFLFHFLAISDIYWNTKINEVNCHTALNPCVRPRDCSSPVRVHWGE